ncbi:patatin-like phospholipase family protein [Nocardia sp. NPDC052254]|uniref:patatin-like phospholipase family protein n=1 Tax=Nocardia sp. NPDC052254 TaxID=3155681 RepID=UPI00341C602F
MGIEDTSDSFATALVLGGGGPVGIAWMAGLIVGLRAAGIDPARAERIVGTSAGSVVGAALTGGGDLESLGRPRPPSAETPPPDTQCLSEVLALRRAGGDARQMRRRIGALAVAADTVEPDVHIERIAALTGVSAWPDADLWVTAVDIGTGELRVWTRTGEATLPQALASSTSVPGIFPPIPIAGSIFVDGGMRSALNADLAAGARTVVILEPLAHMMPRTRADRAHGAGREISIVPDAEAVAAFGGNVFAPDAVAPAYAAGVRQSVTAATRLADGGLGA